MLPFTSLSLCLSITLLCVYLLHKLREVHLLVHQLADHQRRDSAVLFRQLEALQGLYAELGLEKSLPGTRGWAASPDFLMELVGHARAIKPRVVVECSSGTSTLVLARCMELNGHGKVYSLEHDPLYAEQSRRMLRRHGLEHWAVVLDAPLQQQMIKDGKWSWYATTALDNELASVGSDGTPAPIDMLVIDGPPRESGKLARYPVAPLLFPALGIGATVFLDDAARADEKLILERWKNEFPHFRQSGRDCEKGCVVLVREK